MHCDQSGPSSVPAFGNMSNARDSVLRIADVDPTVNASSSSTAASWYPLDGTSGLHQSSSRQDVIQKSLTTLDQDVQDLQSPFGQSAGGFAPVSPCQKNNLRALTEGQQPIEDIFPATGNPFTDRHGEARPMSGNIFSPDRRIPAVADELSLSPKSPLWDYCTFDFGDLIEPSIEEFIARGTLSH